MRLSLGKSTHQTGWGTGTPALYCSRDGSFPVPHPVWWVDFPMDIWFDYFKSQRPYKIYIALNSICNLSYNLFIFFGPWLVVVCKPETLLHSTYYRQNTIYLCRGHTAVIWIQLRATGLTGPSWPTIRHSPRCLHNIRSLAPLRNKHGFIYSIGHPIPTRGVSSQDFLKYDSVVMFNHGVQA